MPILCLEGPSAVGKSSTARYLAEHHAAIHIPEVNLLFQRPENASPYWYFERQVERVQIARSHPPGNLVILDGDPFQPIWYDPLFPAFNSLSYQSVLDFYRSLLVRNELAWPHLYVILSAPPAELRKRKEADLRFKRRNFDAHLALVDFLPEYFGRFARGLVCSHAAETVEGNAKTVLNACISIEKIGDPVAMFDEIATWMKLKCC